MLEILTIQNYSVFYLCTAYDSYLGTNILGIKHPFWSIFLEHSSDHDSPLWTKPQVEIRSFDFSINALPEVENSMKRSLIGFNNLWARVF
jgi:hypothetical protein